MLYTWPSYRYFHELNNMVLKKKKKGTSVLRTSINKSFLLKLYFVQFLTASAFKMKSLLGHRDGQITQSCLLLSQQFITQCFNYTSLALTPSNENDWYLWHFCDKLVQYYQPEVFLITFCLGWNCYCTSFAIWIFIISKIILCMEHFTCWICVALEK